MVKNINRFEITLKTPFSLEKILMSEQCAADLWFFDETERCWVSYIFIKNRWLKLMLRQIGNVIEIKYKPPKEEIENIKNWLFYIFSLDYNVDGLRLNYQKDKYILKLLKHCADLRIMRDINKEYRVIETILTQNTSVKMIKIMQRLLFLNYGDEVKIGDEVIHTYPQIEKIANENVNELKKKCKVGYRAEYLINIAQKIFSGDIDIKKINKMDTEEAKKYLMHFKGIGNKVSDLILMYGFEKGDVFPLDLWVKRAIIREYFRNKNVSDKKIYAFVKNYFGHFASIINLMIFFYERKGKTRFFNCCIWR